MNKKVKKNKKRKTNEIKSLSKLFIFVTCALVFFPPFFRGLFFEREFMIVHIITFATVLIWLVLQYRNKNYSLLRYRYEYFLFAVVAMYFITIPFAASQRAALSEGLKYANYLAIYILARDQVNQDKKNIKIFINTIVASVFIMSLVGLMNYLGFMSMNGALAGNRISSTLQYPNTLAAVIAATIFVVLSLLIVSKMKLKLIYTAILNILIITFVLTFSRTMWIMLPLLFIGLIFVMPLERRVELLLISLATILPSMAAAGMLASYMGDKNFASIAIILASILVSTTFVILTSRFKLGTLSNRVLRNAILGVLILFIAIGTVLVNTTQPVKLSHYDVENGYMSFNRNIYSIEGQGNYILRLDVKTEQLEDKPWLGRVSIVSLDRGWEGKTIKNFYIKDQTDGIVEIPFSTLPDTYYIRIGFYNYYKDTSFTIRKAEVTDAATGQTVDELKLDYKYLPDALATRLESINYKERSVQERFIFFKDAFKIIKDNFIVGLGGRGWTSVYMAYRSYEYWTKETHSYPVQIWIEIGTLGFLLVIGFLLFYAAKVYRTHKNISFEDHKVLFAGKILFATTILLHSLVDFDLSLGAVSIMLWTSLSLMAGYFNKEISKRRKPVYKNIVPIVLVFTLLITSTSLVLASQYNTKVVEALKNSEINQAEKYARTAVKLDPFKSSYRVNLAMVINSNKAIDNRIRYERAGKQLEKAINYDRFNYRIYGEMARHQFMYGNFNAASDYVKKAIYYNPVAPNSYALRMDLLFNMAKYYHGKKEYIKAIERLKELKNIRKMIAEKNKELESPIKVDSELLSYIYKANLVLDNIKKKNVFNVANKVIMYEYFDFDANEDKLPDLWQIPYQGDKTVEGRIVEEDETKVFQIRSDNPSFFTQRMNLALEPSSRYVIAVEGKSKSGNGRMTVLVGSGSGKGTQLKESNVLLGDEFKFYQKIFETTDDIEPGNQYIRLYFNDKEREVSIKRVIIMKLE